ncbi:DNA polymerase III subunit chi [Legionella impletisoli]|uniref:DNA polymerase III subunit chi n=1 Tax=Legionella impletisoli TaxID=343510 RepID=A0A917NBK9_9GAMM|nr:DNA polymerase III subunit chi [Legionella impletisoli]GGI85916.1 DNA polymerase III subunit chi [Legionella impletisoli]
MSQRVDFYLIEQSPPKGEWLLACRLLEKAYLRNHRVFVFCNSEEDALYLDELLWTFKEDSFIPHNLQGEGPEPPPPIQIGYRDEPRGFNDILLNLAPSVPTFASRFKRIIELVAPDEKAKEISREHYRYYRLNRHELYTHKIDAL